MDIPESRKSRFTPFAVPNTARPAMKLFGSLSRLAREQDCALCGKLALSAVCLACSDLRPALPEARCAQCALPAPGATMCGLCMTSTPHYDATIAAFAYGGPISEAIIRLKYRTGLGLAPTLSHWLDQAVTHTVFTLPASGRRPDVVLPMPLSHERLAERGFNQALELARPLARKHRLPVDPLAARRTRHTPPQAGLSLQERAGNVRQAFSVSRRLDGLHVAVVDDVMTTGATLNELARVLKEAGAASVTNWVLARTLAPYDHDGHTDYNAAPD